MKTSIPVIAQRLGAFGLVFAISLFACPLLAVAIHGLLPPQLGNFMFFWPQLALVPFGFTSPASDMTQTYLGGGWNYPVTGIFWLLVGIGISWLLRKRPIGLTALVAVPLAFVVAIAVAAILDQLDIGIYFEGP
jgi:hypothetical protein